MKNIVILTEEEENTLKAAAEIARKYSEIATDTTDKMRGLAAHNQITAFIERIKNR